MLQSLELHNYTDIRFGCVFCSERIHIVVLVCLGLASVLLITVFSFHQLAQLLFICTQVLISCSLCWYYF